MEVDLEADMALDEDETMEADTLNLTSTALGSLLPCLFPEQYHIVNDGLEGKPCQYVSRTPQLESKRARRQ